MTYFDIPGMMEEEQFCLRWNDFETNFQSSFQELRKNKALIDVTLACEDKEFQAHRVILSSCSSFFKSILQANKHQHPWFYLKGIKHEELSALLDFIYNGEVNISQAGLNNFLKVAEDLSIKGLTQAGNNSTSNKVKHSRSNSEEQIKRRRQIQIPKHNEPTINGENEQQSEFIRVKSEFDNSEEVSEQTPGSVCVFEDSSDIPVNPLETYQDSEEHGVVDQTFDESFQGYENGNIIEDPMEATEGNTPGSKLIFYGHILTQLEGICKNQSINQ